MTFDKESSRCLRILAERSHVLEWPCRNSSIPWLIERGYARKVRDIKASWNNREHNCIEISITDAGRSALQQTPGHDVSKQMTYRGGVFPNKEPTQEGVNEQIAFARQSINKMKALREAKASALPNKEP